MEHLAQPGSVLNDQRPVQAFFVPYLFDLRSGGVFKPGFRDYSGSVSRRHIAEHEYREGHQQDHRHHGQDTLENVFSHKILLYAGLLDYASSLCAMTRNFLP